MGEMLSFGLIIGCKVEDLLTLRVQWALAILALPAMLEYVRRSLKRSGVSEDIGVGISMSYMPAFRENRSLMINKDKM